MLFLWNITCVSDIEKNLKMLTFSRLVLYDQAALVETIFSASFAWVDGITRVFWLYFNTGKYQVPTKKKDQAIQHSSSWKTPLMYLAIYKETQIMEELFTVEI